MLHVPQETVKDRQHISDQVAALAGNVNIPLFNGYLYGALRGEADAQALAQEEDLRAKQIEIVKDARRAWLNANAGYLRLELVAIPSPARHSPPTTGNLPFTARTREGSDVDLISSGDVGLS